MSLECEHGSLARSCQICELQAENEALRAQLERQWVQGCVWDDCDQPALYCEGHAKEYMAPTIDALRARVSELEGAMRTTMEFANQSAFEVYRSLLADGCPSELARSVLPLAAYSRMYASVDLHNLLHFLTLRLHEHAQYEIRVYAQAIFELITGVVPRTVACWQELRG